jgi:hypothetical protein
VGRLRAGWAAVKEARLVSARDADGTIRALGAVLARGPGSRIELYELTVDGEPRYFAITPHGPDWWTVSCARTDNGTGQDWYECGPGGWYCSSPEDAEESISDHLRGVTRIGVGPADVRQGGFVGSPGNGGTLRLKAGRQLLPGELEPTPDSPLPVGVTEIAQRAGVRPPSVEQWIRRHEDFPAPRWQVGGRRAWDWREVAAWLEHTGRMP